MLRALAGTAAVLLVAAPAAAAERLVDGIAAQVGGEIVLVSEVMELVGSREAHMRSLGAPEVEIAKLRADGLEQLIELRLIEKVVRQTELYASDEEIDGTIERIAGENGLSLAQVRQSVTQQGLSWEDYRARIKQEIERRKVVSALVANKVRVEEDEVRRRYEERFREQPEGGTTYHLRQILVMFRTEEAKKDPEATCQKVVDAFARIRAGEAFENVAREVSEVAPREGGDIGWVHDDTVAGWMRREVAPLKDGETTGVIRLKFGCSVLKLVERKDFAPISFETARPALEQEVFEEKVSREFGSWIEELRSQTYIERHGYFADAAQLGSKSRYATPEEEKEELPLP